MHLRSTQWWAIFIVHFAMIISNFWQLFTDWGIYSLIHQWYAEIRGFVLIIFFFVFCIIDFYFQIRLIVIDSFSYLFRSLDSDVNLVQITYEILLKLQQIAEEFKCAVRDLCRLAFFFLNLFMKIDVFILHSFINWMCIGSDNEWIDHAYNTWGNFYYSSAWWKSFASSELSNNFRTWFR